MQHPIHGIGAPAIRSLGGLVAAEAAFILLTTFIEVAMAR